MIAAYAPELVMDRPEIDEKTGLLMATLDQLEQLEAEQGDYMPNDIVRAYLGLKTADLFVGASCVGKTTVMSAVEEMNPSYGVAGTFASRDRREDDHKLLANISHTDASLQVQMERIRKGKVVQYLVHPSGKLYGSELWHYPYKHNLIDVMPGSVDGYYTYGFGRVAVFGVVTPPELWVPRFDLRFPSDHEQRPTRLSEARENIQWQIDHFDELHMIVTDNTPEYHAREVISVINGKGPSDALRLETAKKMLGCVEELLGKVA